jgi:hypothetical protein
MSAAPKTFCVITTIQQPTPAVRALVERLAPEQIPLIVVGDKKGPSRFDVPGARFIPLDEQLRAPFALAPLLPTGHYVRKNLGYLQAFASGATTVYETDDDNAPNAAWAIRAQAVRARPVEHKGWVNVYRYFTEANIWPRGLPLRDIQVTALPTPDAVRRFDSPIQQLLCNIAPDVDAVWRLAVGAETFNFEPTATHSIHLAPGAWCPFNSQATWWFPAAFPLMYLPSTCTFRMTDIWRSFIAQRCLWELGQGVTFHPPEVEQERNPHDLMRDFADEVPGYLKNEAIARILTDLSLPGPLTANLVRCYEALVAQQVFAAEEMTLVRAWLEDIERLTQ